MENVKTFKTWKKYTLDELMGTFKMSLAEVNKYMQQTEEEMDKNFKMWINTQKKQIVDCVSNYELGYNWDWSGEVKDEILDEDARENEEITQFVDYVEKKVRSVENLDKIEVLAKVIADDEYLKEVAAEEAGFEVEYYFENVEEALQAVGAENMTAEELFWLGHFSKNITGSYIRINAYGNFESIEKSNNLDEFGVYDIAAALIDEDEWKQKANEEIIYTLELDVENNEDDEIIARGLGLM